jgi:hypothetical protein
MRLRLDVCNDQPLRSWIMSFGPSASVVAPAALALEIESAYERALRHYQSRGLYRMARMEDARLNERSA